jgi:hypothetical protein
MVLESSPPDAVFASGHDFCPGEGERRNSTTSAPDGPSSGAGSSTTAIVAPGIPSWWSSARAPRRATAPRRPFPREHVGSDLQVGAHLVRLRGQLGEPLVGRGERRQSRRRLVEE